MRVKFRATCVLNLKSSVVGDWEAAIKAAFASVEKKTQSNKIKMTLLNNGTTLTGTPDEFDSALDKGGMFSTFVMDVLSTRTNGRELSVITR